MLYKTESRKQLTPTRNLKQSAINNVGNKLKKTRHHIADHNQQCKIPALISISLPVVTTDDIQRIAEAVRETVNSTCISRGHIADDSRKFAVRSIKQAMEIRR